MSGVSPQGPKADIGTVTNQGNAPVGGSPSRDAGVWCLTRLSKIIYDLLNRVNGFQFIGCWAVRGRCGGDALIISTGSFETLSFFLPSPLLQRHAGGLERASKAVRQR